MDVSRFRFLVAVFAVVSIACVQRSIEAAEESNTSAPRVSDGQAVLPGSPKTFDGPAFQIRLSDLWKPQPSEEGVELVCEARGEQLIVSQYELKQRGDEAQKAGVAALVQTKQKVVNEVGRGLAEVSVPATTIASGVVETRMYGYDRSNRVRFGFLIKGTRSKVTSMALYGYEADAITKDFTEHSEEVFRAVTIQDQ